MGMYTEVVVKINFNKDEIGVDNLKILEYLFNNNNDSTIDESKLPNHLFFQTPRWKSIGNSCSFYHHPRVINDWYEFNNSIYIFSRSDLKNYDNEIELFFDWLNTLTLTVSDNEYIGYSQYEDDLTPKIYTYNKKE